MVYYGASQNPNLSSEQITDLLNTYMQEYVNEETKFIMMKTDFKDFLNIKMLMLNI